MIASTILVGAIAWATEIKDFRPFHDDATVVYSAEKMPLLSWVFAHWQSEGYAVPQDGEEFVWSKYAVNVESLFQLAPHQWECQKFSCIQKNDLVFFRNDSGNINVGMVFDIFEDDRTLVGVMQPLPGGLIMIQGLERSKVLGIGRPVKPKFTVPVKPHLRTGDMST